MVRYSNRGRCERKGLFGRSRLVRLRYSCCAIGLFVAVHRAKRLRSKIATLASRLSAVQCAGLRVKEMEVHPTEKADGEA